MILESIGWLAGIYLICGIAFAIAFIFKGVNRIDEGAHGSTLGFKIIIIPGTIIFWPLLLKKWLNAGKGNTHD